MPGFGVKVPHPLGKDVAIERLRNFAEDIHQRHPDRVQNVRQSWEENHLIFSFATSGMSISGRVVVEDRLALVEGQLPFAALIFRGRIEQEIRSQLKELLK